MSKDFKKDYLALQNLWHVCALRYLGSNSMSERMKIIDDFRDCLIDIKSEGKKAIRSKFEEWETDTWIPFCNSELLKWTQYNVYAARIKNKKDDEFENIKQDYNYQRFRKIMQLIQDSGIGLGQGKDVKTIERAGYQDG